jgi:uroporphyrinogen-III synthase
MSPAPVRSLSGCRVVVTRSADQAGSLLHLLRERGAETLLVPLIEVVPEPADVARLQALDPDDFDWVVVTSPNGADAFHAVHGAPSRAKVAAVGTMTASRLQRCDMVPAEQRAEGLLAALAPVRGQRMLVVQAVDAAPVLVDGLRQGGALVEALSPYRSRGTRPSDAAAAVAADAVLFASGSAGRAWVDVFGTATPPVVVAMGPRTAAALRLAGLKVTIVAADHSAAGLVAALEQSWPIAE